MGQKKAGFVRRHFFINKRMQGHYMLSFLIPMVILLFFMLFTLYMASQTIINTTSRIIKKDIETLVSLEFQDQPQPSREQLQAVVNSVNDYIKTFSADNNFKQELIGALLWVFGIGVLLVIIQIMFMTIFFSHKLAGPVYRFERMCLSIINGKYTETIRLRKGDEMQNLANLINEATSVTRERFESLKQSTTDEQREKIFSKIDI